MEGVKLTRNDDPYFNDPRFQRRIVESHRAIPIVSNIHDVVLECGHSPLLFCTPDPKVGDMIFCPSCCEVQVKPQ
jgi:hypothetical protein